MNSRVDNVARTGVWVGIGAIAMSFAAYTSAMVVRAGSSPEWQHFRIPSILYLNTLVLLVSSVTLESGRRKIATLVDHPDWSGSAQQELRSAGLSRLYVTLALGLMFLVGQCFAWRDLAGQGLFLATNPSSAFFYVFTVAHALHLLGGLAGLANAVRRASASVGPAPANALSAVALYWHFMGVLWLYLLVVLALWV